MSFVKKAVKKVFKVAKKVRKKVLGGLKKLWSNKWFRIATIVAASVFTAGIAAGGFAAFSGVTTVSGFMGAVGSTMSAGMASITGGLVGTALPTAGSAAAGAAASSSILAPVGVTAGQATVQGGIGAAMAAGAPSIAATQAAGILAPVGATASKIGVGGTAAAGGGAGIAPSFSAGQFAAAGGTQAAAAGTSAGILGTTKNLVSRLASPIMAPTTMGSMLRTGLILGVQGYMRGKEMEQEQFYRENKTVWGGAAFGGSSEPLALPKVAAVPRDAGAPSQFAKQQAAAPVPQQVQNQQFQAPTIDQQIQGGDASQGDGALLAQQQAAGAPVPTSQPPPTGGPAPYPGDIRPELLGVV